MTPAPPTFGGGSYTSEDAHGRALLTVVPQGSQAYQPRNPIDPVNYVYYRVDATHLYLMSLDSHAGATLVSGTVSD